MLERQGLNSYMNEINQEDIIIENIKMTMALENQFLDESDEKLLRKC